MADFSVVSNQMTSTAFQDRGLPQANNPVDLPLPGNAATIGGAGARLAKMYAVRKNHLTPPEPYMAGRQQTVNM
jgi:hypothetical protein